MGDEQDAVTEGGRFALFEGEIKLWGFGFEDFRAERVGGKEPVAAGVPVGRVAGVFGMVEDGDDDCFTLWIGAGEGTPAASGGPDGVALFAFAGEVDARSSGSAGALDFGLAAVSVGEDATLFVGGLEPAGYADAHEAFLVVVEDGAVQGFEADFLVDGAGGAFARKGVAGGFLEEFLVGSGDPDGLDDEGSAVFAAFGGDDSALLDGAHFGTVFGGDGDGVVPEVEAVDVAVVEPHAGVVGVVLTLAGAGGEGVAARDFDAAVLDQGIEDGLFERGGPDVGGEGRAVDGDVDAAVGLVGDDLDAFAFLGGEREGGDGSDGGKESDAEPARW